MLVFLTWTFGVYFLSPSEGEVVAALARIKDGDPQLLVLYLGR